MAQLYWVELRFGYFLIYIYINTKHVLYQHPGAILAFDWFKALTTYPKHMTIKIQMSPSPKPKHKGCINQSFMTKIMIKARKY